MLFVFLVFLVPPIPDGCGAGGKHDAVTGVAG
jgi:hypothetical protein